MNRDDLREILEWCQEPLPYEMPITFNEGVGCRLDTRQTVHFDELQQAFALQRARQVELND